MIVVAPSACKYDFRYLKRIGSHAGNLCQPKLSRDFGSFGRDYVPSNDDKWTINVGITEGSSKLGQYITGSLA